MRLCLSVCVGVSCAALFLPTAGLPQVVLAKKGLFLLRVFEDAVGIWPTEAHLHARQCSDSIELGPCAASLATHGTPRTSEAAGRIAISGMVPTCSSSAVSSKE